MGRRLQRLLQASRDYEGRLARIEVIINILRLDNESGLSHSLLQKQWKSKQTHTNKQTKPQKEQEKETTFNSSLYFKRTYKAINRLVIWIFAINNNLDAIGEF